MGGGSGGAVEDVFAVFAMGGGGIGFLDDHDDGDMVSYVVGEVEWVVDCGGGGVGGVFWGGVCGAVEGGCGWV